MYERTVKRLLDILFSALMLVVLLPVFLLVAVLIKLDSKGPVIFQQKRVGKGKTYFNIYKFRTMRTDTPSEVPTNDLHGANNYITRLGGFLRKTSLDELPQLLNILKGEMSFIGPRPALWNQYELIELRDKHGANDVLPGLSGWAQVNGRDLLSLEEEKKAEFDGMYAKNISFGFDMKCLLLTFVNVIGMDGVVDGDEGKNPTDDAKTEE